MTGESTAQNVALQEGLAHGRWRREAIYLAVLVAAILVSWIPRLNGPIDLRWDGGVYYTLGTSLAEGHGYRLLNEPGNIEANQYPPLLPAIIAAHQWLIGTNDPVIVGRWLRITYFIIFSIFVFTIYWTARDRLPSKYAFLAAWVCIFNLHAYFLSDLCFPEVPFALATTLFVICNSRASNNRTHSVLAGVFAATAYAMRTAGIALLAAWVLDSAFRKNFKTAAVRSMVSAIAVFSWLFYISAVESGEQYKRPAYEYQRAAYLFYNVSYTRNVFGLKHMNASETDPPSVTDIGVRFLHNVVLMPRSLGESISSQKNLWKSEWETVSRLSPIHFKAPFLVDLGLITLGCLVIGGAVLQFIRRQWIIPLYVSFSVATICITPWPEQFTRYLMPLAPFAAISCFTMLFKIREESGKAYFRRWRATGQVFMGLVVIVLLLQQAVTFYLVYSKFHQKVAYSGRHGEPVSYRLFFYSDAHRAFDGGIDWLRSRAKPDAVVASSMPQWVFLRSGLKSVMPPFEQDPLRAQRLLDSVPVSYLILDEGLALDTRRYTVPLVQTFAEGWKRVYSDSIVTDAGEELQGRFEIYQRIHE